jgi:hypothetical protein
MATRKWGNVNGEGAETKNQPKAALGVIRRARRHMGQLLATDG